MKTPFVLAAVLVALSAEAVDYSITASVKDMDGEMFYMSDYFRNNAIIDSATVAGGQLRFSGTYDRRAFVRIESGNTFSNCVLDEAPVDLDFDNHSPLSGGEINMKLLEHVKADNARYEFFDSCGKAIREKFPDPEQFKAEYKKFYNSEFGKAKARVLALLKENAGNGFGECLLMEAIDYIEPEEWLAFFASLPASLTELPVSQDLNRKKEAAVATSPGHKFVDIEALNPDGSPAKLSDYVGKGKYVLVDFWASWCGPCRQEGRETLKPLYERYKDDERFTILGVATWDKDANTLKTIEDEGYLWPQLIGAGMRPMKIYGFDGIPMIMLFGPDGTIIARNLRGTDIFTAVDNALSAR